MVTPFLILIVVVIITCIWLNHISSRIGVPTLLAFILLGIVYGNVGAIPVHLDNRPFAMDVCTIALIFIMFYGGFGTRWETVKPVLRESVLLASVGVLITAFLTGLFCRIVLSWGWAESLLLGAVVSSTDAASVFSILRFRKLGLKNHTAPMLEVESGSNDPCAYMLTAIMISVVNGTASGGSVLWMIFSQIVFGAGIGLLIAKLASIVLQRIKITTEGFDTLFLFAVAIAAYAIPDVFGGNGYLSCYLVGVILGNEEFSGKRSMVGFFDGLTGLMQVLIFFLLGLLARPALLHKAILPALAISAFMLLVARPVAVFSILTPFRKYSSNQQELISFVGLRGAASIVFAIMAITSVDSLQTDLFNTVFCIVLISISIQGTLIPWVSRKLDMIDANANVMKTFNDYSENSEMQFSQIGIGPRSAWAGKQIMELGLPKNMLIALVIRGQERIIARGDTKLCPGDKAIVVTKTYVDSDTYLIEKTIRPGGRHEGHAVGEFSDEGLVLLVRRGDKEIIPNGSTVLQAGDNLVILKAK